MKREPAPLNLLDGEPAQTPWVCVTLSRVRGSAPREQGACMLVGTTQTRGSIGGGHLEYKAIATARQLRARWAAGAAAEPHLESHALGPALGQCCGGHVELRYELATSSALPVPVPLFHLQLFGAGHVGRALVRALRPLPCHIDWIDEREQEFPLDAFAPEVGGEWPSTLRVLAVDAPEAEIATAPPGAFYLVMTHSHDLDFHLGETILRRADIGWFGLIGSATKRARFLRRWRERGVSESALERLVCPVGIPGIPGKAPEVIAASVAAQLLQVAGQVGKQAG
ncbi:putative Xanthine and CO dehydrogenases maturation factor [Thiomonas arsenitoxydans]|jgi:xanthine dehydrogenase accessory factor|uniref:Xanthine and CO dehydrogenases maturation factor n=1 Tax=Thiomonas arsenitoxydans (strain DSM 22701 / CIP 110005 / 3As) TaxID=426114 RepID=D6CT20_THIA3|nr:xanthine dehydrogenase accessory protein XdhC [Thiomonas arsenitoxydans]MDD5002265.1 xanthine dehydrogenase accessory protein XdhC [Thiomonas arsenitoxydans]CAZ88439.1 putative Xanthine and CO dehydrogenases maturation factor [Thiomonas arsenitoxydans]CQR33230.1 putative Xanthine and CO dehydrogenases maturation factor [Thiomonas arsenitoxydans]CQR33626.1 putative Xanthine and CO dehydrogenases maturation factor [Thiomonas arsenitoxydans]CQR33894.1 putative Xanthine and CO dehydrogenases ma